VSPPRGRRSDLDRQYRRRILAVAAADQWLHVGKGARTKINRIDLCELWMSFHVVWDWKPSPGSGGYLDQEGLGR
jgi:hypothetical protein